MFSGNVLLRLCCPWDFISRHWTIDCSIDLYDYLSHPFYDSAKLWAAEAIVFTNAPLPRYPVQTSEPLWNAVYTRHTQWWGRDTGAQPPLKTLVMPRIFDIWLDKGMPFVHAVFPYWTRNLAIVNRSCDSWAHKMTIVRHRNGLQRSPEKSQFDRAHMISYYRSIVTMALSCIVSHI